MLTGIWIRLRVVDVHRVDGWIHVIAEVQPDRSNRRMVAQTQSRRMGEVVEAARPHLAGRVRGAVGGRDGIGGGGRAEGLARVAFRLAHPQGAGPRISRVGEDVAHVVEEHKAERVAQPGQRRRRQAHLRAVHQRACPADGVARLRIARAGRIDGKTAQRGGSAAVEPLRERNQFVFGYSEGTFLAVAGVAGQHEPVLVEAVIARILEVQPVELAPNVSPERKSWKLV